MKIRKHAGYLFFSFLTLLLLSCDPTVSYNKLILNNTPFTLTISSGNMDMTNNIAFGDSSSIAPYMRFQLVDFFDIGSSLDGFTDCPFYPESGDSILVTVVGPDEIVHELFITADDEWEYLITSQDKKGISGSCECVLSIDEEDLLF